VSQSHLEDGFARLWDMIPGERPSFVRQHRFVEGRKFAFDFAWPSQLVAVELEGGTWIGGRHTRGSGQAKDIEKYNLAVLGGWSVLRYTANDMKERPVGVVEEVSWLLSIKPTIE
jgi:very-short-patch-repair endonuclease